MGEYSSDAGDSGYLDNVMLTTGTTTTTVTIVVTPSITGTIVNTATVNANEPDPNLSDNTANASTTVFGSGLSINDVTVTEGDSGTVNAVFVVTLSAASAQIVTVNYATTNGTATSPADYIATTGVLTFTPGITTQSITVTINGDILDENDETFTVMLTNPVNAALLDDTGIGVITDDDTSAAVFTAAQDAWIDEAANNTNHGAANPLEIQPNFGSERRTLIQFNLSSIPAGSTIVSATLQLNEILTQIGQVISVTRLTQSWTEANVTWRRHDSGGGGFWGIQGGDFDPTVWATFTPNITGIRNLDVTSLVQAWVNGTYPNNGMLLLASGSNGTSTFNSREAASNEPSLLVEYNELGGMAFGGLPASKNQIFLPLIIKSASTNNFSNSGKASHSLYLPLIFKSRPSGD